MLDNFNRQILVWDKANQQIHERFVASSGDSKGRKLYVGIVENFNEVDLTDYTLSLAWRSGEHQGLDVFQAIDITRGIFEITYTTGMLSNVGDLKASLVLISQEGRLESLPFAIEVRKSVVDDEAVQSTDSFTALSDALIKVNNLKDELESWRDEQSQLHDNLRTQKAQQFDAMQSSKAQQFDAMQSSKAQQFDAWFEEVQSYFSEEAIGQLTNQINQVSSDLNAFKNNVEKIRINDDGKFEYWYNGEWVQVTGDGYPVGAVTNFTAQSDNQSVKLKWQDPQDVTITDSSGQVITIATWAGTKILRKLGSYPQNENDGTLVVNNGVRNQYATNAYVDSNLVNGTTYYYSAFAYTTDDIFKDKADANATPVGQKIYGVRIDKNNSNPDTRVSYISDSVGFTPMTGNNGAFSWGSWQSIFNNYEIKPCLLKNGAVQYYLNPNDYTKKANGTASNITGSDGDVMIEFGKVLWWKWTDKGTTYTIEISDKSFTGAVKSAFEIETGYNQMNYYPLLLTQILFVIFFKSTNSQTALGRGYVDGNSSYASTGGANAKGLFYGENTGNSQIKFLGIEDYWGNKDQRIDGIVTDSSRNILIGKTNYNDAGTGYASHSSGVSSDVSGYINGVQGGNDKGFVVKTVSGSGTTYYADYGYLSSSRAAYFGGTRSEGSFAGAFYLRLDLSGLVSSADIGARLFCARNSKIYIGAYLASTVSGKMRSVSGATASDNKTISAFRTEAKANN